MRLLLTLFAIGACFSSQAEVPISLLKADGKASQPLGGAAPWKSEILKLNDLDSARAIRRVRESYKVCKSKEEAFTIAAKWVKLKHASPSETCASIEALYHLQLWVKPYLVYYETVRMVWADHVRLANPKVMEHARQAVLMRNCWDGFSVGYSVRKAVSNAYDDDPAMAALSRGLYSTLDSSNGPEIVKLAEVFEYRSRHLNGLILDEMGDAKSSVGQLLIAAAYGWMLLLDLPKYPQARKECLRLYSEAAAIKRKSKALQERIEKFEVILKGLNVIKNS